MSRSLRLLQLVHGYPPAVGGVEFAVRDICEGLAARRGFEVTVLTTNAYTNANFHDGRLPTIPIREAEEQNGVRVRRFPVETRWSPLLRVAQGVAWRARLPGNDRLRTLYQGPISPGLRRAAAEAEADVICAASFPLNHLAYAFHRRDRVPVVLLAASHPEDRWGYERPRLFELARRAAATVACTETERAWLVEHGAPAGRTLVIPLGVDPARGQAEPGAFRRGHRIPAGAFLVAYVGQQGSHKGIDTLLRCLPELVRRVPGARLVVAGAPTPYSAEVRRLLAELPEPARGSALVLDRVDEDLKASILQDCDVFASPSAHESFGITTIEAWARGRPVVAGDGPAQRELLEGGSLGVLVPYGRTGPLVEALAGLAAAPERRLMLGEAGRARLQERYTLDRVVDCYGDLFTRLAGAATA